jgi:hypothetical protein
MAVDKSQPPKWPDAVTLSQIRRYADDAMKAWIDDRRNRRSIPHRFDMCGYVQVRNEARKAGNWIVHNKRQVIYAKKELKLNTKLPLHSFRVLSEIVSRSLHSLPKAVLAVKAVIRHCT